MLEIGQLVEKYEILDELGQGGMARVLKVKHTMLGSLHALKVLDQSFVRNADVRQRFLAEGQIQARLVHPNIVRITDVIALPGVAGLVMEFIEGDPLDDYIRAMNRPPSVGEVKAVFIPLLSGLGHAHDNGIVHRDIKPSNFIIARGLDGAACPKILDFGIAKIADEALGTGAAKAHTRTGARMGTLHYMSPEQIKGANTVDCRADIFSVAATLYEFVTQKVAFEGDSEYETMKRIIEDVSVPPREIRPDMDRVIEACLAQGLAKNPDDRFPSCGAFATLLDSAGSGAAAQVDWQATRPRSVAPSQEVQAVNSEGELGDVLLARVREKLGPQITIVAALGGVLAVESKDYGEGLLFVTNTDMFAFVNTKGDRFRAKRSQAREFDVTQNDGYLEFTVNGRHCNLTAIFKGRPSIFVQRIRLNDGRGRVPASARSRATCPNCGATRKSPPGIVFLVLLCSVFSAVAFVIGDFVPAFMAGLAVVFVRLVFASLFTSGLVKCTCGTQFQA